MGRDLEQGFTLRGWRVQPRAGRLTKGHVKKTERRVESRAMRVLVDLAQNQGEFRSKDEILRSVWEGRAVGDDCLTGAIHALRQALGDDPRNPLFIETRNNVGYRLIPPIRHRSSAYLSLIGATAAAAVIAVSLWQSDLIEATTKADEIQRVAVLPFMNLSGSVEDEYYAAAMMEALISDLAQHTEIRVISRTSTINYENFEGSAKQVASELGADLLVEGSVQTENIHTSVRARLIDPELDTQLWADHFKRPVGNILELQREIGDTIAAQLGVVAGGPDIPVPTNLSDDELERFFQARYFLAKQTSADAKTALNIFTDLAAARPEFADAHLGRAQSLSLLFKQGQLESVALREAESAAGRFENLAGASAASHRCIGQIRLLLDWDFESAENRYRHALSLNPSDVIARRRFAWLLVAGGRYEQAKSQIGHTRILDPLYYHDPGLAVLLLYAGDAAAAIEEFERVDAISRLDNIHLRVLLTAYLAVDREEEARTTLLRMLSNGEDGLAAEVDFNKDSNLSDLIQLILIGKKYRSSIISAGYHALLGQPNEALSDLEYAVSNRDPFAPYIGAMPEFSRLHNHHRFQTILRDIGISAGSKHVRLGRNTPTDRNSYISELEEDGTANRQQ